MHTPATTPRPICCFPSAKTTSCPSPAAPISPAMITTDNTIMIVWFTPSRIEGFASGSCTLGAAAHWSAEGFARFHDLLGHLADSQVGETDRHRECVDERSDDCGHATGSTRNRTGTGTRTPAWFASRRGRAGPPFELVAARSDDPERDRERDRDHDRDQHLAERSHREIPHAEETETGDATELADRQTDARDPQADQPERAGDHPPGTPVNRSWMGSSM